MTTPPLTDMLRIATPTDPSGHYIAGRTLLALTDRLHCAPTHPEAGELVDQMLNLDDGVLTRLADFFEAAGEKAKESEDDDAFDVAYDFEEAAADVRALHERLHVATERMSALRTPPPPRPSRRRRSPAGSAERSRPSGASPTATGDYAVPVPGSRLPVHSLSGDPLATRSVIARPTATGFHGVYVHWDGYPSHQLPLLLAAHQFRFKGDTSAMAQHLIDAPAISWDYLGADLLGDAPDNVLEQLGHAGYPTSRQATDTVTADGKPASKMMFDEVSAQEAWLDWAYVLRPQGVEVMGLANGPRGLVVGWDVDPLAKWVDVPECWRARTVRPQPPSTTVHMPEPRPTITPSARR